MTTTILETPPDPSPSPRFTFTERLRECAADFPDLSAGQVASIVASQIMEEDRELAEAFFASEGTLILSLELRTDMIRTRRGIYQVIDIAKPGEPPLKGLSEKKRDSVFEKILRWSEFDPISGQGKLLLSFNKPMLEASALYDTGKVVHHAEKAAWKRTLADGLPNDTTTIQEFYKPEELINVLSQAKTQLATDVSNGKVRIRVGPGVHTRTPQLT